MSYTAACDHVRVEPLTFPGDPAGTVHYIHPACLTVTTWTPEMKAEYGDIQEQGCDCENAAPGDWKKIYIEKE